MSPEERVVAAERERDEQTDRAIALYARAVAAEKDRDAALVNERVQNKELARCDVCQRTDDAHVLRVCADCWPHHPLPRDATITETGTALAAVMAKIDDLVERVCSEMQSPGCLTDWKDAREAVDAAVRALAEERDEAVQRLDGYSAMCAEQEARAERAAATTGEPFASDSCPCGRLYHFQTEANRGRCEKCVPPASENAR